MRKAEAYDPCDDDPSDLRRRGAGSTARDAPEPWVGYELTQRYLRELRPRIEALTGAPVRYSWFLRIDHQIAEPYGSATWVVDRYGALESDAWCRSSTQRDVRSTSVFAGRLSRRARWLLGWPTFDVMRTALGRCCYARHFTWPPRDRRKEPLAETSLTPTTVLMDGSLPQRSKNPNGSGVAWWPVIRTT